MAEQRRDRMRALTRAEIKQVARHQMETRGTAGMTLRSIAEQMGFTSQALYRYFPSRDALITELIIDAYTDLATTLESARDARPPEAYGERLYAMLMAYHHWALEHPVDYTLLYGTPIPGYQKPEDQTESASMHAPALVFALFYDAWAQGQLTIPAEYVSLPAELAMPLIEVQSIWQQAIAHQIPVELLHTMLVGWSRLHGWIILEISGHLHGLKQSEVFYRFEVITLLQRMGLSMRGAQEEQRGL